MERENQIQRAYSMGNERLGSEEETRDCNLMRHAIVTGQVRDAERTLRLRIEGLVRREYENGKRSEEADRIEEDLRFTIIHMAPIFRYRPLIKKYLLEESTDRE